MSWKRPKFVTQDFRPPSAGGKSPVERNARPRAVACQPGPVDRERADHDRAAAELSDHALLAAARDLGGRRNYSQRDPESRWVTGRLAALAREIDRRKLNIPRN